MKLALFEKGKHTFEMSSAVARPMETWIAQVGTETTMGTAASQTGFDNNRIS